MGVLAAFLGLAASAYYFVQKHDIEHMQVFLGLFKDFNKRFEELCEEGLTTPPQEKGQGQKNDNKLLGKYLDLCCEEYYFLKRGFIYPEAWSTWCRGMIGLCEKHEHIRRFFEQELQKPGEYYGLTVAAIRSAGNATETR